jgi:hypothetical protein
MAFAESYFCRSERRARCREWIAQGHGAVLEMLPLPVLDGLGEYPEEPIKEQNAAEWTAWTDSHATHLLRK